jgi:hypothetical protein
MPDDDGWVALDDDSKVGASELRRDSGSLRPSSPMLEKLLSEMQPIKASGEHAESLVFPPQMHPSALSRTALWRRSQAANSLVDK